MMGEREKRKPLPQRPPRAAEVTEEEGNAKSAKQVAFGLPADRMSPPNEDHRERTAYLNSAALLATLICLFDASK
jgi:hypothetical protein